MYTLVKRSALIALTVVQLLGSSHSYAAPYNWIGMANNDLTIPGNWSPAGGPPNSTDTAQFNTNGALNPTLGATGMTFSVDTMIFNSLNPYNIITNGNETFLKYITSLKGAGIINNNLIEQTLSCIKGGGISFFNSSNAGNATITYDISSDDPSYRSFLTFKNNSSAGSANIFIHSIGLIDFLDNSSAASAVISLNNGHIGFGTTTAASTAQVSLINQSGCDITKSIILNALSSDSTSFINILGSSLTVGDNVTLGDVISGPISGTGSFVKQGTNTLVLTGTNTYSGGTTVNNGTLIVNTQSLPIGSIPTSATVLNSGTLNFNQTADDTFPGFIALTGTGTTLLSDGSGALTLSGGISDTGKFTLNNSHVILTNSLNSYSGGTTLTNSLLEVGTQTLPQASVEPSAVLHGSSTLLFNQNTIPGTFQGNIVVNDAASIVSLASTQALTLSGLISGSGGLTSSATSATLTGLNTYTGGTSLNGGTLKVTHLTLPVSFVQPSVTINAGTLEFQDTTSGSYAGTIVDNGTVFYTGTANLTLPNTITGSGSLTVNSPGGNLFVTNSGNTYAGGTAVTSGGLHVSAASLSTGPVHIASAGSLFFDQGSGTFNSAISDDGSVHIGTGQNIAITSIITGIGSVHVSGGSILNLSGNSNSYSGGTTVDSGGILQGDTASLQGAIVNNGETIFNQSQNATFNGNFSSTNPNAKITKNGTGTLNFNTQSSGFTGTTNIQQGELAVNSLLGGSVFINPGARLSGIGSISGNVQNFGTIAPGNSIGKLSIGGNYEQAISGTYEVEIDSTGNSDLLLVGGTATLGGTVFVISVDGIVNPHKTYTILHANLGISGVFLTAVSSNPLYKPTVNYHRNDVTLSLHSPIALAAPSHNQQTVIRQLQSLRNPTAEELAILTELNQLASSPDTFHQARKTLDQMSGEQYTNLQWATEITGRQFLRRLYDPLRDLMTDNSCCMPCCLQHFDTTFWGDADLNRMTVWMEGGGGQSHLHKGHNAHGCRMNSYEVSLGAQMTLDRCWTIGLAGEYAHDHVHYHVGGSGKNSIGLIGMYTLYRPNCFYVLGDFLIDFNNSSVTRKIDIGDSTLSAHGKPKSYQTTLYAEAGFDFNYCCLLMQPFIGLELDFYTSRKLCESGQNPLLLSVHGRHHTNAYSRLGVHLSATRNCWTANIDAAWQYRLSSFSNRLAMHFQDFGKSFSILGVHIPRNSFDATAYLSAQLGNNWEAYGEISTELWSRAYTYTVLAGLKYSW